MRWQFFALFFAVAILGCSKAEDPIEPSTPTEADRAAYDQAVGRLVTGHVYGNFGVVSISPEGNPEHVGDALIWGGTALWTLPCDKGRGISKALAEMVTDLDGGMVRYKGSLDASMDGALGAFLGIARRIEDCDEADLWREPLRLILAFQEANHDHINATSSASIFKPFTVVRDQLAAEVGIRGQPAGQRIRDMEAAATSWAVAVLTAHKTGIGADACFRVNLGMTAFLAIETLGRSISSDGRNAFCGPTETMDIPTVQHWCGRQSLVDYLQNYVPDEWEYRHQRCGEPWEHPDGHGNKSPEVDRLVAMVMAYGWRALQ